MPTLNLTYTQLIELVKQLPDQQQAELFDLLLTCRWGNLGNFTKDNEHYLRLAAWKRNRDWDTMTEQEQIDFVDDILHEDRQCC